MNIFLLTLALCVNHIISTNPCTGIVIKNANMQSERRVMTHEEQNIFLIYNN